MPLYSSAATLVGATASVAGSGGSVPAPAAGKNTRALFSDASFGEVPIVPQYKNTTASYRIWPLGGSAQGRAGTIKVRRFTLVYVPADGNIDNLVYAIRTAPTSNFNVHLALWDAAQTGEPSTYLIGATSTITTAQSFANVAVAVTSTAVKRGFYYISITPDTTFTTQTFEGYSGGAGVMERLFIGGSTASSQAVFTYTCATSYDQTTHETFGFTDSIWCPLGYEYV